MTKPLTPDEMAKVLRDTATNLRIMRQSDNETVRNLVQEAEAFTRKWVEQRWITLERSTWGRGGR